MSIPLALTLRTVAKALLRPQWWIDCLTTEPLAGTVVELVDSMFDPTVTSDDLAWIKSQWPGKVGPGGATATRRYGFGPAPRAVDAINTLRVFAGCGGSFRVLSRRKSQRFRSSTRFRKGHRNVALSVI